MMKTLRVRQTGFTLIELLLYVTLLGITVVAASVLWVVLNQQRVKAQVVREVEDQGVMAMQIISQTVRNSSAINTPSVGNSGASLSVTVPTASLSPTVFSLSSGVLSITEGANPSVNLTSSKVSVSSLTFSNLSRPSTPGVVRIQFTVSYVGGADYQYGYSKQFITSVSLR